MCTLPCKPYKSDEAINQLTGGSIVSKLWAVCYSYQIQVHTWGSRGRVVACRGWKVPQP